MRESMSIAQNLDPVSDECVGYSALFFYIDRQYDMAEKYAKVSVNLKADDELARHILILALLGEGKYVEAAQQAVSEMQYAHATSSETLLVRAGNQSALVNYFRWYAATSALQPPDKLTAVFLADAYMHLGEPQQAVNVLSNTIKQHAVSILIPFISVWPSLHPLCSNAAFAAMVHQLGQPGCALDNIINPGLLLGIWIQRQAVT